LAPETRLKERLMLGLRLAEGVDLVEAEYRTGAVVNTPARSKKLQKWLERGVLSLRDNTLRLNKSKWLLSDGIIGELL
jgi:oxygen-independent coproporphyrinogen-3 oxidase